MRAAVVTCCAVGCRALLAAAVALVASGCVTELVVADVRAPEQANVTVRYAAISSEERQFADYSVIDARILTEAAGGTRPAAPPP
jgi:hypothetical protein